MVDTSPTGGRYWRVGVRRPGPVLDVGLTALVGPSSSPVPVGRSFGETSEEVVLCQGCPCLCRITSDHRGLFWSYLTVKETLFGGEDRLSGVFWESVGGPGPVLHSHILFYTTDGGRPVVPVLSRGPPPSSETEGDPCTHVYSCVHVCVLEWVQVAGEVQDGGVGGSPVCATGVPPGSRFPRSISPRSVHPPRVSAASVIFEVLNPCPQFTSPSRLTPVRTKRSLPHRPSLCRGSSGVESTFTRDVVSLQSSCRSIDSFFLLSARTDCNRRRPSGPGRPWAHVRRASPARGWPVYPGVPVDQHQLLGRARSRGLQPGFQQRHVDPPRLSRDLRS